MCKGRLDWTKSVLVSQSKPVSACLLLQLGWLPIGNCNDMSSGHVLDQVKALAVAMCLIEDKLPLWGHPTISHMLLLPSHQSLAGLRSQW